MNVSVGLPESLFSDNAIRPTPNHFTWESAYRCTAPKASVVVRFATGRKREQPALLWETMVHTRGADVPEFPERFAPWIDDAHTITDEWFFKLIEGELEERFSSGAVQC